MTTSKQGPVAIRAMVVAAAVTIAAVRALAFAMPSLVESADARITDGFMQYRNRAAAAGPSRDGAVVHLDIDDRLPAHFEGRPPGRADLAVAVRALGAAGVRAQAYDFVFAGRQGEGDKVLGAAMREAGNAYAGLIVGDPGSAAGFDRDRAASSLWRIRVRGDARRFPPATDPVATSDALQDSARGLGAINVEADRDGVFRRQPLVFRGTDGYYPSLALRVACGYFDVGPDRIVLEPGRSITLEAARFGNVVRDVVIPIDDRGAMRLNFAGDWTALRHFSFGELWRESMDPTSAGMWKAAVGGKVVVVSDVSTGHAHVGAVPGDPAYPLVGLHATAIDTIISGAFLREARRWTVVASDAATLAFLCWAVLYRPGWLVPAGGVAAAALAAAAGTAFLRAGVILPIAEPLAADAAFVGLAGSWRIIYESREREVTRRAFEAYFPPSVVARIVRDRRRVAGTARKELTVLFSDIVEFTPRTSTMAPEEVQEFLGDYFRRMVAIVFAHGGTVDKFMGDGLMVFFNDPDDQPDHAERCVRCAIAMQAAVGEFSAELERAGRPPVRVRVGIHTGVAVVGDLGSPQRLSYTAVGAPVNLAQRLESAAAPGGILISAATARQLPRQIGYGPARVVRMKGFDEPIAVHAIGAGANREIAV